MPQNNKVYFSNKLIFIFNILSFIFFLISALSLLFMFSSLQAFIFNLGCKIIGRELNLTYWSRVILTRARFTFIFALLLGISFILLCKLSFVTSCNFKLTFNINKSDFNKRLIFIFAITYTLLSGFRIFWITQKQTFHIDELYEIGIINRNEYGFWNGDHIFYHEKEYENNKPFTGKDIKQSAFFNDGSIKDCLTDCIHLYFYCNDPPHTSLYYVLHRLFFIGVKTYSQTTIILRTFLLNFLLFSISFYFFVLLITKLIKNQLQQFIIIFIAFINPATLSNTLFFRPFILQETSLIIFSYVFTSFYSAMQDGEEIRSKKAFIQGSISLGFALVSEYFSLFFVGFLGIFIIILSIRKKRFESIYFFITMFFTGLVVAKLLYPDFGIGFFDSRHDYATSTIKDNILASLITSKNCIDKDFIAVKLFIPIVIINFIAYFKATKDKCLEKQHEVTAILFVSSILFMLACNYFAPFKNEIRYTAPVFVFLSLIIIPFYNISNKIIKLIITIFQLSLIILPLIKVFPINTNSKYINHINDTPCSFSHPKYNLDSTIPVFIQKPFLKPYIYPFLNDEQVYYFINSPEEIDSSISLFWYINTTEEGERHLEEKIFNNNIK